MYLCVNGHTFESAKPSHIVSMNPDSANCCPVEWECPECRTEDYGEAVVCQACGEYEREEYAEKCKECGELMCESCKRDSDFCCDDCRKEYEAEQPGD